MQSDCTITRISDGTQPAILGYFDLCPESPDGSRVVYTCLPPDPDGEFRAHVSTRDGREHQPLDPPTSGNFHSGARPQWIDDDTVAYAVPGDAPTATACVKVSTGEARVVPGPIRMYSLAAGLGLTSSHEARILRHEIDEGVYLMDLAAGTLRQVVTVAGARAVHPRPHHVDAHPVYFKHTKWSPDGRRFFVVFHNADTPAFRSGAIDRSHRIKSILVCDADGTGLRYLCEFHHHPFWHPTRDSVVSGGTRPDVGPCLFEHPLDGGETTVLAQGTGTHSPVSPDGRHVATDRFDTPETGTCSLDIIDVATGKGTTLATFPMPTPPYEQSHPHPAWSRDSRRIYFNCAASGIPQLYAVDLA